MNLFTALLAAGLTFALCYGADKGFARLFRGKAQHKSGLSVRISKRYGIFGVMLTALGVLSVCVGVTEGLALLLGGIVVLVMGIGLGIYYLTQGIFYDADTFLTASLGRRDRVCRYQDIQSQKLYLIQGGSTVIELHLADGSSLSLQSTMEGVYPFLDTAFAGWCRQKGLDPEGCDFYDPANSLWFPQSKEDD